MTRTTIRRNYRSKSKKSVRGGSRKQRKSKKTMRGGARKQRKKTMRRGSRKKTMRGGSAEAAVRAQRRKKSGGGDV
jgi:hypothetical protein